MPEPASNNIDSGRALSPVTKEFWARDPEIVRIDLLSRPSFNALPRDQQAAFIKDQRQGWGITPAPAASPAAPAPPSQSLWDRTVDAGRSVTKDAEGLANGWVNETKGFWGDVLPTVLTNLPKAARKAERWGEKQYTKLTQNTIPKVVEGLKDDQGNIQWGRTARSALESAGRTAESMDPYVPGIKPGERAKRLAEAVPAAVMVLAPEVGAPGKIISQGIGWSMAGGQMQKALESIFRAADHPTPETVGDATAQMGMVAPYLGELRAVTPEGKTVKVDDWLRGKLAAKGTPDAQRLTEAIERTAQSRSKPPVPSTRVPGTPPLWNRINRVEPGEPPIFPPENRMRTGQLTARLGGGLMGKGQLEADIQGAAPSDQTWQPGPRVETWNPPASGSPNEAPAPSTGQTPTEAAAPPPPAPEAAAPAPPTAKKPRKPRAKKAAAAPEPQVPQDVIDEFQRLQAENERLKAEVGAPPPPVDQSKLTPAEPPTKKAKKTGPSPRDLALNPKNAKEELPTAAQGTGEARVEIDPRGGFRATLANGANIAAPTMERLQSMAELAGHPKGEALPHPEPLPPQPAPEKEPVKTETEHGLLPGHTYTARSDFSTGQGVEINKGDQFVFRMRDDEGRDWFAQVDAKGNRKRPIALKDSGPELKKLFGEGKESKAKTRRAQKTEPSGTVPESVYMRSTSGQKPWKTEQVYHSEGPFAHIKPSDVMSVIDKNGNTVSTFQIDRVNEHSIMGTEDGKRVKVTMVTPRDLRFYAETGPNRETVLRGVTLARGVERQSSAGNDIDRAFEEDEDLAKPKKKLNTDSSPQAKGSVEDSRTDTMLARVKEARKALTEAEEAHIADPGDDAKWEDYLTAQHEASYWQKAYIQAKKTAQWADKHGSQPRVISSRDNTLLINRAAMKAILNIDSPGQNTAKGINMHSRRAEQIADKLEETGHQDLADELRQAANNGRSINIARTGESLSDVVSTLRHERHHEAQRLGVGSEDVNEMGHSNIEQRFLESELAGKASNALIIYKGYNPRQVFIEIGAHLASGDWDALHLTRDEGRELFRSYMQTLAEAWPDSYMHYRMSKNLHPEMKKVSSGPKARYAKSGQ